MAANCQHKSANCNFLGKWYQQIKLSKQGFQGLCAPNRFSLILQCTLNECHLVAIFKDTITLNNIMNNNNNKSFHYATLIN